MVNSLVTYIYEISFKDKVRVFSLFKQFCKSNKAKRPVDTSVKDIKVSEIRTELGNKLIKEMFPAYKIL